MTWVKICGTTNLEDALTAVDAGADAVGFVFYEKSPRNISAEAARAIVEKLPESVEKIGVFVAPDAKHCVRVVQEAGLTGTQTYVSMVESGTAPATGASLFPVGARHLMAFHMSVFLENANETAHASSEVAESEEKIPTSIPEGQMQTVLLDSGDLRMPGGTGKTFDWQRAIPISREMRRSGVNIVVAGGLTPANVAEAISILNPWGVDVVSGVEATPGKKDPEKVRAFVKAVREADRKTS